MNTRWSYPILVSLIFLAQSHGMASNHFVTHSSARSSSSESNGATSSTNTNPLVDTGNSSTNTASARISAASCCAHTVQTVIKDMTASPSRRPRIPGENGWAKTKVRDHAPSWANALTGWGAIVRDVSNSHDTNTAVAVRNMRVYILHKSGKWETLNATTEVGYNGYKEDFSGNAPLEDERTMRDGGTAVLIPKGSVFHFWPSNNNVMKVNMSDIAGLVVRFQAKLIVNDPSKPDDTSLARYLGVSGADYYGKGKCCAADGGEIGKGRYKSVTTEWRWYNFTTIPVSRFAASTPPLECD
jgi:hypothetical protein